MADVNGDGVLDVVIAAASGQIGQAPYRVRWYAGDGKGGFRVGAGGDFFRLQNGSVVERDTVITEAAFGDVDGDRQPDLVLGGGTFDLHRGSKTGFLAAERLDIGGSQPKLVDWDGDGDLDVVALTKTRGVVWYRNDSRNREVEFAPAEQILAEVGEHIFVVDWNGDGKLDLGSVEREVRQVAAMPDALTDADRAAVAAARRAVEELDLEAADIHAQSPLQLSKAQWTERTAALADIAKRRVEPAATVERLQALDLASRERTATKMRVLVRLRR